MHPRFLLTSLFIRPDKNETHGEALQRGLLCARMVTDLLTM
jgi:hypothetical protein